MSNIGKKTAARRRKDTDFRGGGKQIGVKNTTGYKKTAGEMEKNKLTADYDRLIEIHSLDRTKTHYFLKQRLHTEHGMPDSRQVFDEFRGFDRIVFSRDFVEHVR
jgi:hypothetical protein